MAVNQKLEHFAKLGLVHHLLYPECVNSEAYHAGTLREFVGREDIEALDCCIPYGEPYRERLIPAVRDCGKDVAYALHLFPARKISLASLSLQEQAVARLVIKDQIELAARVGATGFVFVSGADVPENRPAARKAFREFCRWFCTELEPYGITALLEPFDRTVDKKFLYGPIDECVELVDGLFREFENIGIELDMAHLPLMGEGVQSAVRCCGRHIRRVHLGNCVLRDKSSPLYGDMHPPIGIEGGEIDVEELTVILRSLLEAGYLSEQERKPLIMEMTPFPGKTQEFTISQTWRRLREAWSMV